MTPIRTIAVGFAADALGGGVAYGLLEGGPPRMLRVPFRVSRYPALLGREIGYAALTAVAGVLRRRGCERVRLIVEDPRLVEDLREHRDLPPPLALAYVRLRCELNQFKGCSVAEAPPGERRLTARAAAEVAMQEAA